MIDVEELVRLAGKATDDSWSLDGIRVTTPRGVIAECPVPQGGGVFECSANAQLIASLSPDVVLALCEVVQKAQALADAADAVGIKHFDTDDNSAEVEAMSDATITLRKALSPFTGLTAVDDLGTVPVAVVVKAESGGLGA